MQVKIEFNPCDWTVGVDWVRWRPFGQSLDLWLHPLPMVSIRLTWTWERRAR